MQMSYNRAMSLLVAAEVLLAQTDQTFEKDSAVAVHFKAGSWPSFVSAVHAARLEAGGDPAPAGLTVVSTVDAARHNDVVTENADLRFQLGLAQKALAAAQADLLARPIAVTTTQVGTLTTQPVSTLSSSQVGGMSTNDVSLLGTQQVQGLTTRGVGGLATQPVGVFATSQLGALATQPVSHLVSTQASGLSSQPIGALSSAQVTEMSTSELHNLA